MRVLWNWSLGCAAARPARGAIGVLGTLGTLGTLGAQGTLLLLILFSGGGGGGVAWASGYHPPFDRAVQEAPWILHHRVVSEHAPRTVLKGLPADTREGRVYRVVVKRSFKGPFKVGQQLLVWDPRYGSTAAYSLNGKGENLSFLAAPGAERRTRGGWKVRTYGAGVTAKNAKLKVAVVFRNKSDTVSRGRGHGMKDWMTLLRLTKVGTRKTDLDQVRRELSKVPLAAKGAGRELLRYIFTHWPGPLGRKDEAVIRRVIKARLSDAYVTTPAVKLLRKNNVALGTATLRHLLSKGSKYGRQELIKDVSRKNVGALQQVLWAWIDRDEQGALKAIEVLGRLRPAYLAMRLRARWLPFWLAIPTLKALGATPRVFGKPDYPAGAMKANPYELVDLGKLVKGKVFGVWYATQTRNARVAPFLPLVVPHLPKMKPRAREVAIAALRTWGYDVKRSGAGGKGATLSPRKRPSPLTLTLETVAGAPNRIRLVEKATRKVLLCLTGGKGEAGRKALKVVRIAMPNGTSTSTDQTGSGFYNTTAPKGCFRRVAAGDVVHTEEFDLTSLLTNLKRRPGEYQVTVSVVHPFGGVEHGLDAWTGMVFSTPVPLTLPLPAAAKTRPGPNGGDGGKTRPAAIPPPSKRKGGCGCYAAQSEGSSALLFALLVLLTLVRRSN